MTNFQNYVLESLSTQAMKWTDEEKVSCLINHYEKNIELYENVVASGLVSSPAEIVDNDYFNLHMIYFNPYEDVNPEKIKEIRAYFNKDEDIYFEEDTALGCKYLYSLTVPITNNFNKEELLKKEATKDEDFFLSKDDEEIEF